jgi:hypothetical protein
VCYFITRFCLYFDHVLLVVLFYHILLVMWFDHTHWWLYHWTRSSVVILITYFSSYYWSRTSYCTIRSHICVTLLDHIPMVLLLIACFRLYHLSHTLLIIYDHILLVVSLIDGLNYRSHILAVLLVTYFCSTVLFNPINSLPKKVKALNGIPANNKNNRMLQVPHFA